MRTDAKILLGLAAVIGIGILGVIGAATLSAVRESRIEAARDAKTAKRTQERQAAAAAAFRAMPPAQHADLARQALKAGNLAEADRHAQALPPGHPAAAGLQAEMGAARDRDPGPRPNPTVLTLALRRQLRESLHDPSSLDGPSVFDPVQDRIAVSGRQVACWRVPFEFRAANGFGAIRLSRGAIWMKGDESLRITTNP